MIKVKGKKWTAKIMDSKNKLFALELQTVLWRGERKVAKLMD